MILTQKFAEKDERMARRSVAETVVEDLRVLAIDEPKAKTNMVARDDFGRTVTLQVTPEQAQKINVATELGKLSLTLRPTGTIPAVAAKAEPTPQTAVVGRRRLAGSGRGQAAAERCRRSRHPG